MSLMWAILQSFSERPAPLYRKIWRSSVPLLTAWGMGKIETIAGAVGGVRYLPDLSKEQISAHIEAVCERLQEPERILPGGASFTRMT